MITRYFIRDLILMMMVVVPASLSAAGMGHRVQYEDISVISAEALKHNLQQSVIIDVRSTYEFSLFHIKGAINIPASDFNFLTRVAEWMPSTGKQLVFYCNGGECIKSFQAARRFMNRYDQEVKVYRGGLKQWAEAYPHLAVMQGCSPVQSTKLIDDKHFKQHLLNTESFSRKVSKRDSLLLDIRDRTQRSMLSLFVGYEFHTSLDEQQLFDKYIAQAIKQNRSLLIYDAAGKQVEWLMYYLEASGVKSYYFLEGGAKKYFRDITASL